MRRKKSIQELEKSGARAMRALAIAVVAFLILIYDVAWTHFHQTGIWNFFSIIAILLIALMPSLISHLQVRSKMEQAYIKAMLDLMLKHNLRHSGEHDEVRKVANLLTFNILERLGTVGSAHAKGRVVAFLHRAELIHKDNPVVSLADADLCDANFNMLTLLDADLSGALLYGAHLNNTTLTGANLSGAKLGGADLTNTDLTGADLCNVRLRRAKLQHTMLRRANLTGADADTVDWPPAWYMGGAIMPNGDPWQDSE